MITRSFANGFALSDWTEELVNIPNQWGTFQELGLFSNESVAEHTVTMEEQNGVLSIIQDKMRGERASVDQEGTRVVRAFAVPHFPLDTAIFPSDIQGKRAYGNPNSADNLAAVRMRKMEYIRKSHAATLEVARAKAIVTGDVYAPNKTVVQNWNTEFGVTRKEVNFDFANNNSNIIDKIEEVVRHIQMNLGNGGLLSGMVCLCSHEFFSALIAHPKVAGAFASYASTQEPMRNRLATGFNSSIHRKFWYMNVDFIEINDVYATGRLIPANEAYFLPTGTDTFVTYFSPANKFEFNNTLGEEAYMFEYLSSKGDKIEIQSESNFVNVVRRPDAIVKATK